MCQGRWVLLYTNYLNCLCFSKEATIIPVYQRGNRCKDEPAQDLTSGKEWSKILSPASSDSIARDVHVRLLTDDGPETQGRHTCPRSPREITTEPGPEASAP